MYSNESDPQSNLLKWGVLLVLFSLAGFLAYKNRDKIKQLFNLQPKSPVMATLPANAATVSTKPATKTVPAPKQPEKPKTVVPMKPIPSEKERNAQGIAYQLYEAIVNKFYPSGYFTQNKGKYILSIAGNFIIKKVNWWDVATAYQNKYKRNLTNDMKQGVDAATLKEFYKTIGI